MSSSPSAIGRIVAGLLSSDARVTLLAVCPNSRAVALAALRSANRLDAPMIFAATLNQIDVDGGYTGWTPSAFAEFVSGHASPDFVSGDAPTEFVSGDTSTEFVSGDAPTEFVSDDTSSEFVSGDASVDSVSEHASSAAGEYPPAPPSARRAEAVLIGLDHGGPWTRDEVYSAAVSLDEAMCRARSSVAACLDAGYALLHIDATVDPHVEGEVPLAEIIDRTVELIAFAEEHRLQAGLAPVAYEVGTEEVHGGMADRMRFTAFVEVLKRALRERGLPDAWPVFFVGRVGTDLHTSHFDPDEARALGSIVKPHGSLIKGHYTDYVDNPEDYPVAGVGGANVGPEFADIEVRALDRLCALECSLDRNSNFKATLREAVVRSGRWKKWVNREERLAGFDKLEPSRQDWLVHTGSRYVWREPDVADARENLYRNVSCRVDADAFVVGAIESRIDHYLRAFNLAGFAARVEAWRNG